MRNDITLNLFELTVVKLLALIQNVTEKFSSNAALFPAPPYSVVQMEAKRDEFANAISAATNGSLADRKLRNKLMLEVRDMLRAQANYVRNVANGDVAILAQSGFALRRQPEPNNVVGTPGNVVARSTFQPNTIMLKWGRTPGGIMFRAERADGDPSLPETAWSTVGLTSRQSLTVSGLEPYKEYFFRVVAIGKNAEGKPSDVVMGRAA
jgi:Fibronectin type III domain